MALKDFFSAPYQSLPSPLETGSGMNTLLALLTIQTIGTPPLFMLECIRTLHRQPAALWQWTGYSILLLPSLTNRADREITQYL